MEYIVYVAVVSGLLFLCSAGLYGVRRSQPLRRPPVKAPEDRKQENKLRLQALGDVPTPWGWPGSPLNGHGNTLHGAPANGSLALQRWVDGLIAEKQTTRDSEYLRRREASLRALLEDRFHSPSRMVELPDRSTASQESSPAVNDGTVNGAAGYSRSVASRPIRVNGHGKAAPIRSKRVRFEPLSTLRTPWGW